MPRHIARWQGRTSSYGNALPSLAYWRTEVADLVTFAESRPVVILQDLQQYGFGLPASLDRSSVIAAHAHPAAY